MRNREMIEAFKQLSQKLFEDVEHINWTLQNTIKDYEDSLSKYQDNGDESNEKRLEQQETWYDKNYENYCRCLQLIEIENMFTKVFEKFQEEIKKKMEYFRNKKEEFACKLNNMIDNIKMTESEIRGEELTELEDMKYDRFMIECEEWKERKRNRDRMRNVREQIKNENSLIIMKSILNRGELQFIQNEIDRFFDWKIFDSNIHCWRKDCSNFHSLLQNQSHFIIVIETVSGLKFGCYVENPSNENKLTFSKGFLFNIWYSKIEKRYDFNESNLLRIGNENDEELFYDDNKLKIMKIIPPEQITYESILKNHNKKFLEYEYQSHQLKNILVMSSLSKQKILFEDNSWECHFHQLKRWIYLTSMRIIFHSEFDNWTKDSSTLNDKIVGKKQLVFLIEDTNDELFGYYLDNVVIISYEGIITTNRDSFLFNLKSNGRLPRPMKFEIKDTVYGGYHIYENNNKYDSLIGLGDILLLNDNMKNFCCCWQHDDIFNYHGIQNALCGIQLNEQGFGYFTPKRFIVIEMY